MELSRFLQNLRLEVLKLHLSLELGCLAAAASTRDPASATA